MAYKRFTFSEQAFLANYALLREHTIGTCGAVVKRNAYGTNARRAVSLLQRAGCRHFFVATTNEGIEIRDLTTANIYVLAGPADDHSAKLIAQHALIPVLNSPSQLHQWRPYQERRCAVHVDTGMHRLGFEPSNLDTLDFSGVNICLLITHLACADQPNHVLNRKQLEDFQKAVSYFPDTATSIGNSAGVLLGEEFQGDITRPGIGLYGGNPFVNRKNPVATVCTLEGQVLQIRTVEPNVPVGYGASFISSATMRVAVVGVGYADGLSRALSNNGYVAYQGQRMPIIGKISMELTQVDCTAIPELKEHDYVEFFGGSISVDEVASWTNTIPYEVLSQVGDLMSIDQTA